MKTKLKTAIIIQLIFIIVTGIIVFCIKDKSGIGFGVIGILAAAISLYNAFFLLISLIILQRMKAGRFDTSTSSVQEVEKYIPMVYFFSLMPIAMIFLLMLFYFVLKQKIG